MSKRFVDTARYRQAWRKLDPKLRAAYYWLTENADAAGFWTIDLDHFKFECGYALDLDRFIKETGTVTRHGQVLQLNDFIEVNYGTLKEGYNPHKPALRALAHHQNSSLVQACPKLEDKEEDEGEDNSWKKERASEKQELIWPAFAGEKVKAKWAEFIAYRIAEKKQRYRSIETEQKALNLVVKYFHSGPEFVSALEHTMAKTWVFPVDPVEYKYPPVEGATVKTGWNPRA